MTDVYTNLNGQAHNVTPTQNRNSQTNKAYHFFDNTTFLELPNSIIQGKSSLTFMMWVKVSGAIESLNQFFISGIKEAGQFNDFLFNFKRLSFNHQSQTISGWDSIVVDQWYHIAVAFNNERVNIYLNGEITQKLEKQNWTADINGFVIGQDQDHILSGFQDSQAFKGSISDLRFYDGKLSPDVVWQIYQKEKYLCGFGCTDCDFDTQQCKINMCKGNRILINGQCLCPNGTVELLQNDCQNQTQIQQQNLLAHIPMNTLNITDIVNDKNGINNNCSQQYDRFGNEQSAYKIKSTSTWITTPCHNIINGKNKFTMAIWVKKMAPMDKQYHIIHGTYDGDNAVALLGNIVVFNNGTDNTINNLKDSFIEDVWQHLIYVINENSYQIYINGEQIEYGSKSQYNIKIAINGLIIGQDQDQVNGGFQTDQHWGGDISDFRIYENIPNQIEARNLYNAITFQCASGCLACITYSYDCGKCKGNRLLFQGKCLCPQGTQDDHITENCVDIKTKEENGLLLYYPFQNNAKDVFGGNDGEAFNLNPTTNRFGQIDCAFTFTGQTDSYFKGRGDIINGYVTYTFQAWIRYIDNNNQFRIIFSGADTGQFNNIHFSDIQSDLYTQNIYRNNQYINTLLKTTYLNKWCQIIFVIEQSAFKIYLNGKLAYKYDITAEALKIHKDELIIGQEQDEIGGGFKVEQSWVGDMSDIKIYNRAKSIEEIQFTYYAEMYPCDYSCSHCLQKNTDCAFCKENRILDNGKCICPTQFYIDQNNDCKQCESQCKTCEQNANNCTSCKDLANDVNDKCIKCVGDQILDSNWKCICIEGKFIKTGYTQCQSCNENCKSCEITADNCLECKPGMRDKNNICNCVDGYYGINCNLQCNKNCKSCEITADNCLECKPGMRDNNNICNCTDRYYGNDCNLQCNKNCKSCEIIADNCLKCKPGIRDINNICNCIDGYYGNDCNLQCNKNCKSCEITADNCLECKPGRRDINNICNCTDGYYGNDCNQKCSEKCISCEFTADNCKVECQGFILYPL